MPITNPVDSHQNSAKRGSLVRALAIKWLRENRSDVLEAIWRHVDKVMPPTRGRRVGTDLPDSLKDLK